MIDLSVHKDFRQRSSFWFPSNLHFIQSAMRCLKFFGSQMTAVSLKAIVIKNVIWEPKRGGNMYSSQSRFSSNQFYRFNGWLSCSSLPEHLCLNSFFTIFLKVAVPTNMPIQTIKNRFLFYVESIFHLSFCKKNHYSAKTITHRKKKKNEFPTYTTRSVGGR